MKPTEYRDLIQQFLNGYFDTAEEFARIYITVFQSEPAHMTKELFDILEDFWEDVEAYSPLWEPEDISVWSITEETLKEEACETLAKLEKYIEEHLE